MASISVLDTLPGFRQELESQGKAETTIKWRIGYLQRMARDCAHNNGHPLLAKWVGPQEVATVFARYKSNASRNACTQALRSWFTWCIRMKYCTKNQMEAAIGDRKYKDHKRAPKYYLPVEKFRDALRVAGEKHPQRRIVIALMLFTLGRQGELSTLRLGHVDMEARKISMYRSKTREAYTCVINPDLDTELQEWLEWYATAKGYATYERMMKEHPDWYLVPRLHAHGTRVLIEPSERFMRLEIVVQEALTALGVVTVNGSWSQHVGEGGHTIRRSGARAMLDYLISSGEGKDKALLRVQMMLGHKDPIMTLRYIGYEVEKAQLDEWLTTHSMYGFSRPTPSRGASAGGNVVAGPWRQATGHQVTSNERASSAH